MQHECIPQAILGMDILCQAKSGMGKTAVFVLATLQQIEPVDGQVSCALGPDSYIDVCLPFIFTTETPTGSDAGIKLHWNVTFVLKCKKNNLIFKKHFVFTFKRVRHKSKLYF